MRDAFGGAFMIKLFLVFIIIYVGFTAIALNYAKAFKAKNIVIAYLEDNEISDLKDVTAEADMAMREYFEKELVGNLNYVYPINCSINTSKENWNAEKCFEDIGVYIEQVEPTEEYRNKLGTYYRVTTYFGFQLPFFDRILAVSGRDNGENVIGRWRIVGETRPIAYE